MRLRIGHRERLLLVGLAGAALVLIAIFVRGKPRADGARHAVYLGAAASPELINAAVGGGESSFALNVAREIQQTGVATVTMHVGLSEPRVVRGGKGKGGRSGDPQSSLCWGSMYGVETFFPRNGWKKVFADKGDASGIVRRAVFQRRVEANAAWRQLGVTQDFDLFVLACAWPYARLEDAMRRPLVEGLVGETTAVNVGGRSLSFGGASVMSGYVGPNRMLHERWNPLARLGDAKARKAMGIFYACSMSAAYFHQAVVERGLYPVLFAREPIVPEAYVVDGMLKGFISGEFDDVFLRAAAKEYSKYQKKLTVERALGILYR